MSERSRIYFFLKKNNVKDFQEWARSEKTAEKKEGRLGRVRLWRKLVLYVFVVGSIIWYVCVVGSLSLYEAVVGS
jgi:hypothetical protein